MRSTIILTLLFGLNSNSIEASERIKEFKIIIKDHLFIPSVIKIPANTKVRLVIDNQDKTPEEFESYELNREKIIMGNKKANIYIGPLSPGKYPFFGEFNPKTAQGVVVVESKESRKNAK